MAPEPAAKGGTCVCAAELRALSLDRLDALRALNAAIFPVRYNDRFYDEAARGPPTFVRLAYVRGVLAGSVCCRREPGGGRGGDDPLGVKGADRLYIMTLGVLASYREQGVGAQLIRHVLGTACVSEAARGVREVYLHVQEGNEEALKFYARFGFVVKERLENYYRKIDPPHCFIVSKDLDAV